MYVNALPPDTPLACWMEGLGGRIELIQIPQPRPAADAFEDEHYVGYYHLSFDTDVAAELPSWLTALKERFTSAQKTQPDQYQPLKVLLSRLNSKLAIVYEVAFIADADGHLEFIGF